MTDDGERAAAELTLTRLGWHIDRREWSALAALLDEHVAVDYTEVFGGEPTTPTGAELVAQWRERLGALDATQHLVTNVQYEPLDDGAARATANVVGTHVSGQVAAARLWTIGGWWETRLTRREAALVVSGITLHPSWQTGDIGILDG